MSNLASGQSASPLAGHILVLSDLHFDPMVDRSLVDRLAASEPGQWTVILDGSENQGLGPYGRDTNWRLLRSALTQSKQILPNPAFVLVSGDFLAHDFRREFDGSASDHSDAAYRVFLRKTMEFLAQQLAETFPATAILPALGNNDEECGDYQLQPGGPFLADTYPIIRALIGSGGAGPGFEEHWKSYGNYSVRIGGIRLLSINTNFFSIRYRNACGSAADANPGRATLDWLEGELAAAKAAGERLWLLYHIPPGTDGYATLRRGACPDHMIPMWDETYAAPFRALSRRYRDIIAASFAGHTHMDDFRLLGDADGPYAFVLITPAVSPIFAQNPAFRTVVYDAAGGILDQTTYDLTNLPETGAPSGASPSWQAEYTFTQEWRQPRVDLPSLDRLYGLIRDVPEERHRWHRLFPVSSSVYWTAFAGSSAEMAQADRAFRCASGNILLSDYQHCYCDAAD